MNTFTWRAVVLLATLIATAPAFATDYLFAVACPTVGSRVVTWQTGTIDLGKGYLRVETGLNNPGCSVSDYNDARDHGLPRAQLSHEAGVIQGVTGIAKTVGHYLGF
jgi:hypothetical protein